ncbi:hypothetical protein SMICM304S_01583 [Streptomyces microflavus]
MLPFVTDQLWWTNVRAEQIAGRDTDKIQEEWAKGAGKPGVFAPGQGFAIMHIPKLDVVVPIAEGINKEKVLDRGMLGHYGEGKLKTAMPEDKQGNFAVAGHRNTHGEPFRYVNTLTPGDPIVVETEGRVLHVRDDQRPAADLAVQHLGDRTRPGRIRVRQAGPVPHADDLHPGVHECLPTDRLGQDGRRTPAQRGKAQSARGLNIITTGAVRWQRGPSTTSGPTRPRPRHPAPARGAPSPPPQRLGEPLITAGLVLALFVAYSLWWTNVLADREADKQGDTVRSKWADGPGALDTKDGIGFLHVPAMKNGEVLVKKGTDPKTLNNGIAGYYTDPVPSALPWDDEGNFTLAAHRDGHGAKFHNIDKLKNGDAVVFETKDTWYVYKVYKSLPETSKFNVDVIQPVPEESGAEKPGRYITLTTCTPVYTSKYRYIVWGELERTEKVDKDRTKPVELL